ncbi:type I-E CRISPR-associated protein Cse1/CasA [uncultured Arthrobacter sp.]|uniref:type I-E CRISPR-associated protein Cse1/CasA n=1 Tax=uncultured Arthrobacter sp. TaxID=114050 RepID=UPI0028D04FDA|nr:type I-E CRISPR-associated protein Cse1/CasA [uncultured Arthrobacter sp.]
MDQDPVAGSALTDVPWIRTSDGPMTVQDALLGAHNIAGFDPGLNGIESGAQIRFLAAVAALIIRRQGGPLKGFAAGSVLNVIGDLEPACNLFDADRPFLQAAHDGKGLAPGQKTPVKRLYPWMPADRAEDFWTRGAAAKELSVAEATLALAVHHHYSFGGNNRIDGRACVNGSPGIRYPGIGFTATELLWHGASLFETLMMNLPKSWVEGTGLPAWADPSCAVSHGGPGKPEHPLWRATWGSNTAQCLWADDALVAVSIGGSRNLPPTMRSGKEGAKEWWDLRNTEDPFYLYLDVETKNAAGVVTSVQRKAQRLDFGHQETDLVVEWNAKGLSAAVRSRSRGAVKSPGRSANLMFLRHLVEGTATCPVVRRTEVLISSPKKWVIADDRTRAVSQAAGLVKAVCAEVAKPFTLKGRLTALRDRRGDAETAFWRNVTAPFEEFIINGTGTTIDPAVWPRVRAAALDAFDEIAASAPGPKLAPFIMSARSSVARNISGLMGPATKPDTAVTAINEEMEVSA